MTVDRNELYRYLTRKYRSASTDDVHDAVQYAVVVAYEASTLREPPQNVQAYITTVASRALARSYTKSRNIVRSEPQQGDVWDYAVGYGALKAERDVHDAAVDASSVLHALPATYAEVLRKHYLEGLSFEEIGRNEGVAGAAVRKRHERALKHARKMFAERA